MTGLENDARAVSLFNYDANDPDRRMPLEGRSAGVHALVGQNTLAVGGPPSRTVALLAFITDLSPFTAASRKAADLRDQISKQVAERMAGTPEHADREAADAKVQEIDAQLEAAEKQLADATAAREQAIADRTDPRPFRAAITAAQADVDDLAPLRVALIDDRSKARRRFDEARDAAWRELALEYRAGVMGEWRELVADIKRVLPEIVERLVAVDACEKMLAK